jgi:decaprenylphospho-beta-D-ribofuranose 2-oxidase
MGRAIERGVRREVLERLSASGNGSFLAVLKRLGPASPGHLSFPIEGITLAVDMSASGPDQAAILARLDTVVARAGGRIYLVNDSRMEASLIPAMCPRQREWAAIVNRHDPEGMFTSSLVRRLNLRGHDPCPKRTSGASKL